MISLRPVAEFVGRVPSGVWVALAILNMLITVGTWSTARRRMRRAGQRAADPQLVSGPGKKRDTALTVASMIPAALFWAMVLAGSFHSLIAFGREVLGWRGGWACLVPGTLDGVSVTFAFLAFRAVRKQKAPDRCNRVVWGAAVASAIVNFAYEYTHSGHNLVAGGYLALLSLFGMVMFHEFLDQFEEGSAYIKRANPKFGLRWITLPTNTFCAAVAWHNYPPAEGTPATVLNAIANLDQVRALKRETRQAAISDQHRRALADARRLSELAAAKAGARPSAHAESRPTTQVNHRESEPAVVPAHIAAFSVHGAVPADPPRVAAPADPPARRQLAALTQVEVAKPPEQQDDPIDTDPATLVPTNGSLPPAADPHTAKADRKAATPTGTDVRVPQTAETLLQWVDCWMTMFREGLATGPISNTLEEEIRQRYGWGVKQLRYVRSAALSGELRRQALNLGVDLPPEFVDKVANTPRINGRTIRVGA